MDRVSGAAEVTVEEMRTLKNEWLSDPAWDIEDTERYEAHREELLAWRLGVERDARERRQRQLEEKAEQLGVPGNVSLAGYVDSLEVCLAELRERVKRLEA